MDEAQAERKADDYLTAIITNQPTFFPLGGMGSPTNSLALAQNVAKFRATLIEEFKKQP